MTENIKINKTSECQLKATRNYINKNKEKHLMKVKEYYLNHKDDDEWLKNKRLSSIISTRNCRRKKREKQIELMGQVIKRGRPKKLNFIVEN